MTGPLLGGGRLLGQIQKVIPLTIMASKYSKARLEGRALEHALSCQGGSSIRMYDGTKWHYVSTKEAADIRSFMKTRVDELWEDLSYFGLTRQKGRLCYRIRVRTKQCGFGFMEC